MRIPTNDRQAHPRHGLHRKAPEHTDMAMTATHQHDIAQDGLFYLFHEIPLSG
jgi:hypothetical protein